MEHTQNHHEIISSLEIIAEAEFAEMTKYPLNTTERYTHEIKYNDATYMIRHYKLLDEMQESAR